MKVTVTQLDATQLDSKWSKLIDHVQVNNSELVLLPEMAFSEWFCASADVDELVWDSAVQAHDMWLNRLSELGVKIVMGTAPRNIEDKKYNMAYIWTAETGIQWVHGKTYLPNEEGFWEATWYDRAPIDFQPFTVDGLAMGVMICTEMWFMQHAREYGQQGVQLIISPRSTPFSTNDKWIAGGRSTSVIAGAFCLSSNHAGQMGDLKFGGAGWITDPESTVLGVTSEDAPFVTVDIDLADADVAKQTYPRYVDDSDV